MNYKFTQQHRLQNADDFSSVFVFRKVRFGTYFKIHFKPNELNHSRLGLIVSKKNHKRANKRNYMKRTIREYFRLHQNAWSGVDMVVRVQKYFTSDEYPQIMAELNQLCSRFLKKS
jgi:ribonuclease P protein component